MTFSQLESTPLYPCLGHEIPVTRKERKDVGGEKYSRSGGGDGNAGTIASNYVKWPVSGLGSGLVPPRGVSSFPSVLLDDDDDDRCSRCESSLVNVAPRVSLGA